MENSKILGIMVSHHALIEIYLTTLIDKMDKEDFGSAKKDLKDFKWQLEKHFFTEEKVIFPNYTIKTGEIYELISHIKQEHEQMLGLIADLEGRLEKEEKVSLLDLQKLLTDHRALEEKTLYPLLDKEFSEVQKEVIIQRINDIVLKQ